MGLHFLLLLDIHCRQISVIPEDRTLQYGSATNVFYHLPLFVRMTFYEVNEDLVANRGQNMGWPHLKSICM